MDLGLAGKVALVAGSSRGMGKAIAEQLLQEGARVVITGRDRDVLNKTAAELKKRFDAERLGVFAGDLSTEGRISQALKYTEKTLGPLDCLVANIGSGVADSGWDLSEKEWNRVFEKNLWSSVRLVQAALPGMVKRKSGSILSVASIVGLESLNAPLSYSSAKAALIHFNKNLSRLVAPNGIRVNVIAPGNILFPGGSWEKKIKKNAKAVNDYIRAEVPMQRFGTVDEVASLAVFVLSGKASFVTGSCFVADGGQLRSV